MASEGRAWRDVQSFAAQLKGSIHDDTRAIGRQLDKLARDMRAQLLEGTHQNPALMIVGNPPKRGKNDWSKRVYSIQYKHLQDGKDYEHDFEPGTCLRANADGSVTIYRSDGRPVWEEFPG